MSDIKLPKRVMWPSGAQQMGGWADYLPLGFHELGVPVEASQRLREKTDSYLCAELDVRSVGAVELVYEEKVQKIWYDVGCFTSHHGYEKIMGDGDLYFKIRMTPEHREKYPRMFPIGNRVTKSRIFFSLLPKLRRLARAGEFDYDILAILRLTKYDIRVKAVELVRSQPWRSQAWLTSHPRRPTPPEGLLRYFKYGYSEYLAMQAKTKIGFAPPGVGDFTFRQIEFMAMGRPCLITKPNLVPVANGKGCWIEIEQDLMDFVDKVNYYLEHDEEREKIALKGQAFYEKHYSPRGQARYILEIVGAYS